MIDDLHPEDELAPITGRVKWFDATRGFGFLVSDSIDGDVLIHFSVLREHGRRSVPEGAEITCVPVRLERGFQAKRILSIDLSQALPSPQRSSTPTVDRADRRQLQRGGGDEFRLCSLGDCRRTRSNCRFAGRRLGTGCIR